MTQCSLGILTKQTCDGRTNEPFNLTLLVDLNDDISQYLKEKGPEITSKCTHLNGSENWLIKQRAGEVFDNDATVCPKHRDAFVSTWNKPKQRFNSCNYPAHKGKATTLRKIPITALYQIEIMFSTPCQHISLPIGSEWCDNCRKFKHKKGMADNHPLTSFTGCNTCYKEHDDNDGELGAEFHEPKKKKSRLV